MIERTLRLTRGKVMLAAAVYAALVVAHFGANALFRVDEQVFLFGATILIPLWAISAAVYSFDRLALWRGARWRRSP